MKLQYLVFLVNSGRRRIISMCSEYSLREGRSHNSLEVKR